MSISRFVTADTHLTIDHDAPIPTVCAGLPGTSSRYMWIAQRAHSYTIDLYNGGEHVLSKEFVGESCFDDLAKFLSFVN
jgi:hypothetical protein